MPTLPSGFELHLRKSPLTDPWEPLFSQSGLSEAVASGGEVSVTATAADGTSKTFQVKVRVDTPQEAEYYRSGGILPYVLRQVAAP